MELPRALMPWAAQLEMFPRELILALGPLVQRIDRLIGPLRTQGRHDDGDPDGFDGLIRRGPYDRLLLSEWLLAEEAPDEFTRRAVMNEHAFLKPARREPAGSRTSVALFDAGPDQIGSPRIVQLASLIVLERRARAVGAGFQWGVIQNCEGSLHEHLYEHLDAVNVRWLLGARSTRLPTDEALRHWRDRAGSKVGADDLWLVGSPRLRRLSAAAGAARLEILDPFDPDTRSLTVTAHFRGRSEQQVTLDLPEGQVCAHLLRDPFCSRTAEPLRAPHRYAGSRYAVPTSNLLFVEGHKLLARSAPDRLVVYPVPNSPSGNAGKPKVYASPSGGAILAAGRSRRGFTIVTGTGDPAVLRLEHVGPEADRGPSGTFIPPIGRRISAESDHRLASCLCLYRTYSDEEEASEVWFVDLAGGLTVMSSGNDFAAAAALPDTMLVAVLAGRRQQSVAVIAKAPNMPAAATYTLAMSESDGIEHGMAIKPMRSFEAASPPLFGYRGEPFFSVPPVPLIAYKEPMGEWRVLDTEFTLTCPKGSTVFGVITMQPGQNDPKLNPDFRQRWLPGLVTLDADRRRIAVLGMGWSQDVPAASSEIVEVTASLFGPEIAYTTAGGELVIYSLVRQAALYRLTTERAT